MNERPLTSRAFLTGRADVKKPHARATSTLRIRCQYVASVTAPGSFATAVYRAWVIPLETARRVASRMRRGANPLERDFLCTHRRLMTTTRTSFPRHTATDGAAVMYPTNLFFASRREICPHSGVPSNNHERVSLP